jgi:hypothetical protein
LKVADQLVIGLSSWIIQDGNYPDFLHGVNAFAIEFAGALLEEFVPDQEVQPSLSHLQEHIYDAIGQVVHVADDWWVIDVGVLAFREHEPPAHVRKGAWLRGEISIGVDPFFYFEALGKQSGAPALIYDWDLQKIEMQTSPLIEVRPRVLARDPAKLGWKEIAKTDAWEDDGGHAEYLLHCSCLGDPRWPASKRRP